MPAVRQRTPSLVVQVEVCAGVPEYRRHDSGSSPRPGMTLTDHGMLTVGHPVDCSPHSSPAGDQITSISVVDLVLMQSMIGEPDGEHTSPVGTTALPRSEFDGERDSPWHGRRSIEPRIAVRVVSVGARA